jgi:hypothetical protein
MDLDQENLHGGSQLGHDAADYVAKVAEKYCAEQRDFLQLANQPRIAELHIEGQALLVRKRDLEELLRRTPRPCDGRQRRISAIVCGVVGVVLMSVAFFFSMLSLEPFRLGVTGTLVCVGIALITPYAVHEFLEAYANEHLRKGVVTLVFLSAVAGGALLAGIRSDLLVRQVRDATPSVVIDSDTTGASEHGESFYEDAKQPMRLLMILLALAIDLGAGIAIHRAVDLSEDSGREYQQVSDELAQVCTQLGRVVSELVFRTNAPAVFEKGFWRDFYRAMLTQSSRRAVSKVLGLFLCLFLFSAGRTFGQQKLNLVIGVDLTASEKAEGRDGKSRFEKNVRSVAQLLGSVPAGSAVTVIGITENSFGQPFILLSATISNDSGYFGERLASARRLLVSAWRKRSLQIEPSAKNTDLLGAMLMASELFRNNQRARRLLIVYSDMLNTTDGVNFEKAQNFDSQMMLAALSRQGFVPELQGVTVKVLGADASGLGINRWNRVKQFWKAYFTAAGANIAEYSPLDESPLTILDSDADSGEPKSMRQDRSLDSPRGFSKLSVWKIQSRFR